MIALRATRQAERDRFVETLRNWRRRKGIKQAQAAEIFGISLRTLQGWEQALGPGAALAGRAEPDDAHPDRPRLTGRPRPSTVPSRAEPFLACDGAASKWISPRRAGWEDLGEDRGRRTCVGSNYCCGFMWRLQE